ncbi:DUF1694 domain-containing protein [Streptococcus castoreus]|uniref:DUF1694 domain-containing protein n=1 Tax=Streptococcus castoreus TaxID=254786 RepID=UPI00041C2E51|nr:DUF1694 domain-containing protein [Streptococcus castoreus]
MKTLDDKLLKSALGEKRLNPDQQRYYLGTYAERVVLNAPLKGITQEEVKAYLEKELPILSMRHKPLFLKISSKLDTNYQMVYMKLAKQNDLPATIITEKKMTSPFALVLHTDHALNLEETRIEVLLSQAKKEEALTPQKSEKPKSFWQKLFNVR